MIEVPANARSHLFAHVRDGCFTDLHGSATAVRMCGDGPVTPVLVTLDPNGDQWGWWDAEDKTFCMIFPRRMLVEMCFTYGSKVEEERDRGRVVQVRIEPRDTVEKERW